MTKHLLIIDDEPGHRLMVRAVMEDDGWQVSEAGSGEEGVRLFTAAPHYAHSFDTQHQGIISRGTG